MPHNHHYLLSQKVFRRFLIALLTLFTLAICGLMFYIPATIQESAVQTAIKKGIVTLKQFSLLRAYYTDNVVNKVLATEGFASSDKHKNIAKTIPLPATLIKELSKQYESLGVEISLFSPYPFTHIKSKPLKGMKQVIWQQLNANPNKVFSQRVVNKVSVAIADIMISESCVNCHNNHQLSVKKDWQVGDVRGVLQIDIDISKQSQAAYNYSYRIISVLVLLLIGVFAFIVIVFKNGEFEKVNFFNATHDQLTQVYNRLFFFERLELALNQADRNQYKIAVFFIDLDGFKFINDHYGHDAGDKVLLEVAKRLNQATRDVDTLARLGGDEFAVLMVDISEDDMAKSAVRMNQLISEDIYYQGRSLQVSCSIGISIAPDNSCDNSTLLKMADKAMYQAKHAGKNTYQFFNDNEL